MQGGSSRSGKATSRFGRLGRNLLERTDPLQESENRRDNIMNLNLPATSRPTDLSASSQKRTKAKPACPGT